MVSSVPPSVLLVARGRMVCLVLRDPLVVLPLELRDRRFDKLEPALEAVFESFMECLEFRVSRLPQETARLCVLV